ncbi:hypothetical protein D2E22_0284 [Bifidobacterium castoris]|uniref:ASCH domain-containing protein n=2 Tax=Bifidobacterium castoris TaxID=2306972 RepID=A0A430FAH2_9BIFI|nr:hypothetical protein D2E22_0284 [Bifidobacterium castoris]
MRTRSITIAKLRRDYWGRIQRGEKRFEIRDDPVADSSVAFVFKDADTGDYLGCARIKHRTDFGGGEASPWNWPILSVLSTVPIPELKELFPLGTQIRDAEHEYTLYVYEIEPIDSETLLSLLIGQEES